MADMMDTLKGLLGDNADGKISDIMKILSSDNAQTSDAQSSPPSPDISDNSSDMPAITPEMLMAAQSIMSRLSSSADDDRTKLLMSLKPYMNSERKSTIDNAVKMLRLSELSEFFKGVI